MKIAISVLEKEMDAMMDARFARCSYFAIVDMQKNECEWIENQGTAACHGGAVLTAQQVVSQGVEALITGFVGPNAMKVLEEGNVKVYRGKGGTVEDEITLYEEGKLEALQAAIQGSTCSFHE
ncbi:NifB/NifX family molybdenum-iron cluster-binding protein [Inediibacterium massiliense]|uniref:NifB/NifX family molybdenum-iron cluster-binding protein n=1 Tax=Inediibacterium massiliense TaxID=1658111 RepID=UPI0006B4F67B|nr:NifB/NifX family molybdenum-iron cluster-binding protein [Inediibacterium massiliense]